MEKVHLDFKKKVDYSYNIYIGKEIASNCINDFLKANSFSYTGVITDSNVNSIYREKIEAVFPQNTKIFDFKAGEEQKNIDTVLNLSSSLLKAGFDRKSILFAFGGGVVGDITGFLASIYMRGIPFVQIPTTLLAMVDSSIGGKTGVDTESGKNLIGTFCQPKAVIIDIKFLETLPEIEILNGMAEIIKHGIIFDRKYFLSLKDSNYEKMVKRSCEIKGYVVSKDEKESGLRQILNFGHTIGHGIEKYFNFSIPHGICVALGMLIEARISLNKKILNPIDYEIIEKTIVEYGYNKYLEKIKNINFDELFKIMLSDKKNIKGNINIVLIEKIGKVYNNGNEYSFPIKYEEILNVLKEFNIL